MFGIKKHILELKNSFVSLAEAIGLQKGPKALKKAKGLPRGPKAHQQPIPRGTLFGPMCQNILVFRYILKYLLVDYGILG